MFGQPYRRSTDDENSDDDPTSLTSNATSRATTNDSWHDVKSDSEQEKLRQLNSTRNTQVHKQVTDSDDDDDDDDSGEDESLIKSIDDIYINGSVTKKVPNEDQSESEDDDSSTGDEQKQKPDTDLNTYLAELNSKLLPTNDSSKNAIDNQARNVNETSRQKIEYVNPAVNNTLTSLNPSEETSPISSDSKQNTANNLQNEQTTLLSNNNNLESPILNQQQTLTNTIGEVKPWTNPYWPTLKKDDGEQSIEKIKDSDSSKPAVSSNNNNLNKNQDSSSHFQKTDASQSVNSTTTPWINPYWDTKFLSRYNSAPYGEKPKLSSNQSKNNFDSNNNKSQNSGSIIKEDEQWENPYWKDKASTVPNTPVPQDKPWVNPYWKDKTPQTPNTPKPQEKPWENPYWKEKTPQTPDTSKPQEKSAATSDQKNKLLNNSTPNTPKLQDKPWENPYWKDKTPQTPDTPKPQEKPAATSDQKNKLLNNSAPNTPKLQDKPWENPYWKDKAPSTPDTPKPQEKSAATCDQKNKLLNNSTPNTPKLQDKPWENPYWKDKAPSTPNTPKPQEKRTTTSDEKNKLLNNSAPNTPKPQGKSWQNPYWKDKAPTTPGSAKPQDKPWENPYWKDKTPTTPGSGKPQEKPWENPYWKDKTPTTPGSGKPQEKPWENPYWKNRETSGVVPISTYETATKDGKKNIASDIWTLDNNSPPDHKVPPIPSFYQRIYPKRTPPSSPRQSTSYDENNSLGLNQGGKPPSNQLYNQFTNDDDDVEALPYTTDGNGVVHYRAFGPSSPTSSSKKGSLIGEALKSQNLISGPIRNGAPSTQQNNPTISALPSSDVTRPSPNTNKTSSISQSNLETLPSLDIINRLSAKDQSSIFVLHFDELCDIQTALRTVETRSGSIPTIESYQDGSINNNKNNNSNVANTYSGYDSPIKVHDRYQPPVNPPPRSYPTNNSSSPKDSLARFMKNGPAAHI